MITASTSKEELLAMAVAVVKELHSGEHYTVPDLFRKVEWRRINISMRKSLGRSFYDLRDTAEVNSTPIGDYSPQLYCKN